MRELPAAKERSLVTSRTAIEQEPGLSCRALVFSYGKTPALRGISLAFDTGEITAISGPSGSGKSTLMLCLAGVLTPQVGEVRFGGRTVSAESEKSRSLLRRTDFGVLFQFGQLVPELLVEENVALPLLLGGVNRKEATEVAKLWLDRFGVADLAKKRPSEISGGQGQRVAAARAMVTEPAVLFADEPTGALDSIAGEHVLNQIVRVARESGTTALIITHDAKVAAYADREIVIRDGMVDGDDE